MIKKLVLGGVSAGPKSARDSHPIITLNETATALLEQFVVINPQFKTLKNQSETLSKQLAPHIKEAYFTRFAGTAPESSTMLVRVGATTVKLITKSVYSTKVQDEADIIAAIGEELTGKWFRQKTDLSFDLTKMPEDKADEFANRVLALAQEMGVTEAVTAKQCIQPRPGFHEARTSLLTAEQNLALDGAIAVTAFPQI